MVWSSRAWRAATWALASAKVVRGWWVDIDGAYHKARGKKKSY
jgi:hypothetical protein